MFDISASCIIDDAQYVILSKMNTHSIQHFSFLSSNTIYSNTRPSAKKEDVMSATIKFVTLSNVSKLDQYLSLQQTECHIAL